MHTKNSWMAEVVLDMASFAQANGLKRSFLSLVDTLAIVASEIETDDNDDSQLPIEDASNVILFNPRFSCRGAAPVKSG